MITCLFYIQRHLCLDIYGLCLPSYIQRNSSFPEKLTKFRILLNVLDIGDTKFFRSIQCLLVFTKFLDTGKWHLFYISKGLRKRIVWV